MIILNSTSLTSKALEEIGNKTNKPLDELYVLFITTGANVYRPEEKGWLDISRFRLVSEFGHVEDSDIRISTANIDLDKFDIIYIAGGSVSYLINEIRKSYFDKSLKDFLRSGGILVGEGAGAIILGQNIEPWLNLDMSSGFEKHMNKGLGLVKYGVIPHWESEDSQPYIKYIKRELERKGEVVLIKDGESIIIQDEKERRLSSE